MQNDYMADKEAVVTVRIPVSLKRRLEAWARKERRSLSAQIRAVLERSDGENGIGVKGEGPLLGRYEVGPVPNDADFREVRQLLWGSLGKVRRRRAA